MLRRRNKGRIERYDVKTFNELTSNKVNGLGDGWTLTSRNANHCLHVTDSSDVYRVGVLTNSDESSWLVGGNVWELSVNRSNNVLVSCHVDRVIKECSTNGSLVRSIQLQVNHVIQPVHTVKLTDSHYVVCHSGPAHGVSLMNQRGELIATYRNSINQSIVQSITFIAYTINIHTTYQHIFNTTNH